MWRDILQLVTQATRLVKSSQKTTEASLRATQYLIKKKKAFSDGAVVKKAMLLIAKIVLEDEKYGSDVISTLSDVQLCASAMVQRVSAMSANLADQLDRDLVRSRWFSIQCHMSVDSSSAEERCTLSGWRLMIFTEKKNS